MIERRRWPSPTLPRSTSPLSSGPRWAINWVMRSSSRASATAPRPNSKMPAMPHIAGTWTGDCSRTHRCGHGTQQLLNAMPIGMFSHDEFVSAIGNACPIAGITKPFDRVIDVREVLFDRDVMLVRFQNAVVVPFEQERSEEHTSELQSRRDLVCRLLLEKKKK